MIPMSTYPRARRLVLASATAALVAASLPACVPLVVGGAAVGAGLVATDRRSSGAQLDDQAIELRAMNRLHEIANDQMEIGVTSYNRQVLLTGSAGSEADRQRAEQAVRGVENVRSVVDEVRVGPARSFMRGNQDTLITAKVKASLLDAKDLPANVFKVVTEDGVVYLMGLATPREIERASDLARGVAGVQRVVRLTEPVTERQLAGQAPLPGQAPAAAPGASVPLPPVAPPPPAAPGVVTTPVK